MQPELKVCPGKSAHAKMRVACTNVHFKLQTSYVALSTGAPVSCRTATLWEVVLELVMLTRRRRHAYGAS